jgi:hypothetical protein
MLERNVGLQVTIVGLNGIAIINNFVAIEEHGIDAQVAVVLESHAG